MCPGGPVAPITDSTGVVQVSNIVPSAFLLATDWYSLSGSSGLPGGLIVHPAGFSPVGVGGTAPPTLILYLVSK